MTRTIEIHGEHQQIEGRDPEIAAEFAAEAESREYRKTATVFARQHPIPFAVHTPEGVMEGEAGDYLVTSNPPTHMWPVRREIFEATYRPVESEATP